MFFFFNLDFKSLSVTLNTVMCTFEKLLLIAIQHSCISAGAAEKNGVHVCPLFCFLLVAFQ